MGCGVGGQTLHLVEEVPSGTIVAMDSHVPSISRLQRTIADRQLSHRVTAVAGDMAHPDVPAQSIDLIWSEGALYSIGLRNALRVCYGILRPGGYLVFTDAIWRKENPPSSVKTGFDLDYPSMGTLADDLAAIDACGFECIDHFTLPDQAWWDDFYTPWRLASRSCVGPSLMIWRLRTSSTSLQQSLICTDVTPNTVPTSFS
jgi:SAM-dependent methyltransferase